MRKLFGYGHKLMGRGSFVNKVRYEFRSTLSKLLSARVGLQVVATFVQKSESSGDEMRPRLGEERVLPLRITILLSPNLPTNAHFCTGFAQQKSEQHARQGRK